MSKFYVVEPEVAAGFGEKTVFSGASLSTNKNVNAPEVMYLDFRFDGWMGDDVVNFMTAYAVTDRFVDQFNFFWLFRTGCRRDDLQF